MEQFLIVILASRLNERMILIGIGENVNVWWKIYSGFFLHIFINIVREGK